MNTLFTSTIKEPKNLNKRRTKAPSKTVQIQITRAGKKLYIFKVRSGTTYLIENNGLNRTGRKDVQGQTDYY